MATSLSELLASTPLSGGNAPYVEALYEQFLADPQSVEPHWRDYFLKLQEGRKLRDGAAGEQIHSSVQAGIAARALKPRLAVGGAALSSDAAAKQGAVLRLVQIYANRGHLIAKLDPLGMQQRPRPRVLELAYFGLSEADLDTEFLTGSRPSEVAARLKLREIIAQLEHTYCGTIGAEFAHVSNTEERLWLKDQFLVGRLKGKLDAAVKAGRMTKAEERRALQGVESRIDDLVNGKLRQRFREHRGFRSRGFDRQSPPAFPPAAA